MEETIYKIPRFLRIIQSVNICKKVVFYGMVHIINVVSSFIDQILESMSKDIQTDSRIKNRCRFGMIINTLLKYDNTFKNSLRRNRRAGSDHGVKAKLTTNKRFVYPVSFHRSTTLLQFGSFGQCFPIRQ